jgi:hypothetical protein
MSEVVNKDVLNALSIENVDLEAPIADSRAVVLDCLELASIYRKYVTSLDEKKDADVIQALKLIHQLCFIHFKPSDRAEPFGPMCVMNGKRSSIPSDFRGEQNGVIAALAPRIRNPALRARMADVAWLNDRRLAECGRLAVHSYLECIEYLLKGQAKLRFGHGKAWDPVALEMLRRALVIAGAMGRDKPEAQLAGSIVERVRDASKAEDDPSGRYRSAQLALDFRTVDASVIGADLEMVAGQVFASGDFPFAVDLYEEAERAWRIARNTTQEELCAKSAAECYVAWADASKGSAMSEAHSLQQAIAKLRNTKGTRERRKELQTRLVAVQSNIRDEMGVFTTEIDLTKLADHARAAVAGRSLIRALAEFAQLVQSPDPEVLRVRAQKTAENAPLLAALGATMHDREGKVVARSPGIGDPDATNDAGLQRLILEDEAHRRGLATTGMIEPARQMIQAEHPVEERDLLPLMKMSPFVPPSREVIFARAFARFFGGDFMSAVHLIFPQLENSLRFLLKQSGFDATIIKVDMTQQDMTISVMLENFRPQLEEIFGAAIANEIDNVFNIVGGPSIRHSAAHGLLDQDAFWSQDVVYACWFIFSLCVIPMFGYWDKVEAHYAGQGS